MWLCYCDRCNQKIDKGMSKTRNLRIEYFDEHNELGNGKGYTHLFNFCDKCVERITGPIINMLKEVHRDQSA